MARVIRVAVIDDHPVTSAGVVAALSGADDIEIVGQAGSIGEINALVEATAPAVLLCDVQLGNERALHVPSMLAQPAPAVLFFSGYDYPSFTRAALDAGAAGYVLKSAPFEELLAAIRAVAKGGTAWESRHLQAARKAPRMPSERELEVLTLVAAGRSNAEIGSQLAIEERTVESHLRRLFVRYGASSRTELTAYSVRNGWVDLSGS